MQGYAPVASTSNAPPPGSSLYDAWPETKDLRRAASAGLAPASHAPRSRDDLEALLRDDQYFDAFFNTLPRVQAYHDALDAVLKANEDITGARDQLALPWRAA
jgi:hypothetical protein